MKRLLLLLAVLATGGLFNPQESAAKSTPEIVADTKPAIVLIVAFDINSHPFGLGTGFFIQSPDKAGAQIVTNNHVIQGAAYLRITDLNGSQYGFDQVIAWNEVNDLAILALTGTGNHSYLRLNLSAVEGQNVLVIGNPEGLQGTVSPGIISAIRPDLDRYQITAPISPGSSGSPVLNEEGEVIGVVASYFKEGQNLNFAIPAARIPFVGNTWPVKNTTAYPKDVAQMPPPTPAAPATQVANNPPTPPSMPSSALDSATYREVATLVYSYMLATQNGKPISLAPYCTTRLTEWYGQKNLTLQQAEQSITDYYRTWPYQTTHFDPAKLQVFPFREGRPVAYTVALPFDWTASNGKKSLSGQSVFGAIVILTTNGYGYRIIATMNEKVR